MRTHTNAFWTQKAGSTEQEYQDAWKTGQLDEGYSDADHQRFAISDGASEAIYSKIWADLLTEAWLGGQLDLSKNIATELSNLSAKWASLVPSGSLPWWAEEKIRNGSYATLAGLVLKASPAGVEWEFQAIGDSCMFLLENGELKFYGPVKESSQFANPPYLISTTESANFEIEKHVQIERGIVASGEAEFVLVTDAMANWMMRSVETGTEFSNLLIELDTESPVIAFHELVERLRVAHQLRNDDVTLISVVLVDG